MMYPSYQSELLNPNSTMGHLARLLLVPPKVLPPAPLHLGLAGAPGIAGTGTEGAFSSSWPSRWLNELSSP